MDSVAQKLLQAVLDDPEDDGPRAVYGDYLAERGDPRGEFIAVQLQLHHARRGESVDALKHREAQLREEHGEEWAQRIGLPLSWVRFRRGFIERVAMNARVFLETGERMFEVEPVRWAELNGLAARYFVTSPSDEEAAQDTVHLGEALFGNYRAAFGLPGVRRLAQSKLLRRLRALALRFSGMGAPGAAVLADSPHIRSLRHLDLAGGFIHDDGVAAIAGCPMLRKLTDLDLSSNFVGDAGIRALAFSTQVTRLRKLVINASGNAHPRLSIDGVRALAESANFRALRSLTLRGHDVGNEGAKILASSPALAHLEYLRLQACGIGLAGARALSGSTFLRNLRELDLRQSGVDVRVIAALADRFVHASPEHDPGLFRRKEDA